MPSEYWRTRLRAALLSRPTSVSSSSTRAVRTPIIWARDGQRLAAAAARVLGARRRAARRRAGPGWRARGRAARAPPSCRRRASESPTSIRIVVVLPAPLGPRNPVTVPGSQRNETSLTTVRPPRRFVSPVASIMAPASGAARAREHGRAVDAGIDFGRGSQRRCGRTLRRAMDDSRRCSRAGCCRSPGAKRTARDWIVDATMLAVALVIGALAFGDSERPALRPRLRSVDLVLGVLVLHPAVVAARAGRSRSR